MNAGLIITQDGSLPNGLKRYRCEIWKDGATTLHSHKLANNVKELLGTMPLGLLCVAWIAGKSATRSAAKLYTLQFRKRAPGAGRKTIEDGTGKERVTVWMTPAGIKALKKQAKTADLAHGECIEQLLFCRPTPF